MSPLKHVFHRLRLAGTAQVAAIISVVLLSQVLALVPPYLLGSAVDGFGQGQFSAVYAALAILFGFALFRALATPFQSRLFMGFIQSATRDFSVECTKSIFQKDFDFFTKTNVGGLIKKSERGIEGFESFLTFTLFVAIPAAATAILVSGYLTYLAGWPILVVLATGAASFVLLSVAIIRWRRPFIDDVNDAEDDLADDYAETYLAASALRSAGRMASGLSGVFNAYGRYADKATRLAFASGTLTAAQELITTSTLIASLLAGVLVIAGASDGLTAGDFVVVFTYVAMFMNSLQQIMEVHKRLDQYRADIAELNRILSLPEFRADRPMVPLPGTSLRVQPFELDGASWGLLRLDREINLHRGQSLAIVGETGAGKTSLLRIIAGLTTPPGAVFVDGTDITSVAYESLTDALFYGPQEARFLSGEFHRSVLFDATNSDVVALKHELAALELSKFEASLLDEAFPVATLSGGEKRRFATLRAILARKPILILDEPTGELDAQVASKVWSRLFAGAKDQIFICATHDESALSRFDIVVDVVDGNIRPRSV